MTQADRREPARARPGTPAKLKARFHQRICEIEAEQWDALFGRDNPFLRHDFLSALEDSGCVSPDTGWAPQHLVLSRAGQPVAIMPVYLKTHSYGEFVFDWSWAEAYARHGLDYYPKLVTAAPFTPSAGPRIGFRKGQQKAPLVREVFSQVQLRASQLGATGWHLLFPAAGTLANWKKLGMHARSDVQFHWQNRGHADFGDFLATLRSSRRKNLNRERRSVRDAGVRVRRIEGPDINDADWSGFYRCYRETYLKRSGHDGYLNRDFFQQLRQRMPECLMLVVAERADRLLASALFLKDSHCLYGRYWGALEHVDCLHFECCFYQGIEYCVEQGLDTFDPGTQGEHKLLRGFEPVETRSLHWLADSRFHSAIGAQLRQERAGVRAYARRARALLPYHRTSDPG